MLNWTMDNWCRFFQVGISIFVIAFIPAACIIGLIRDLWKGKRIKQIEEKAGRHRAHD